MSQRIEKKNSFCYLVPYFLQFCHWKCHKKLKKNSFPFHVTDDQEFCHCWKCNENSAKYLTTLLCFIQMYSKIATGNVTKIQNNSIEYFPLKYSLAKSKGKCDVTSVFTLLQTRFLSDFFQVLVDRI